MARSNWDGVKGLSVLTVSLVPLSASERPHAQQGFTDDELTCYNPDLCVNCDAVLADDNQGLYCSALCREKAKFVRYARGCLRDGRADRDPDVAYALRIRMAVILGGGYPPARSLPPAVRPLSSNAIRACAAYAEPRARRSITSTAAHLI